MAAVVVIGSGWGQLAAAMRLAARGHSVHVLSAHEGPPELRDQANRVLVPAGLRELFGRTGADLADRVALTASEPAFTMHLPGGATICLPGAGVGPAIAAVADTWGESAGAAWRGLLADGSRIWGGMRQAAPVPEVAGPAPADAESLLNLARRQDDVRVGMLAMAPALLAGLSPAETSQAAVTLAYLEATFGVWQVSAGLAELARAMIDRVVELGGLTVTATEVALSCEDGRVVAVDCEAGRLAAELVVLGPATIPAGTVDMVVQRAANTPATGHHVWFPHGLQPHRPLAIAGWVAATAGEPNPGYGDTARLVIRQPPGRDLGVGALLDLLAAAGTDLRNHVVEAAPNRPATPRPQLDLPARDLVGLVTLGDSGEREPEGPSPRRATRRAARKMPWGATANAPWTGMIGQLMAASAVHPPASPSRTSPATQRPDRAPGTSRGE